MAWPWRLTTKRPWAIFNLAGAALFDWSEIVPQLAERHNLPVAEARLPFNNYFELDLSKIKSKLGFQPATTSPAS